VVSDGKDSASRAQKQIYFDTQIVKMLNMQRLSRK